MSEKSEKNFVDVIRGDGRYPLAAFAFLNECLERAAKAHHGERSDPPVPRHVTGEQLCQALREEAIERWGMLARTVLATWNIHCTMDVGNMVYLLVSNELMQKTDEDSVEDFRDVFAFDEAFGPDQIFEARS